MKYAFIICPLLAAVTLVLCQGCVGSHQPTTRMPSLPEAYNTRGLSPSSVVVTIDNNISTREDLIQINGHNTSARDILENLKAIYDGSQGRVIIEAADDVRIATIATVVDAAFAAKFGWIGFANRVVGSRREIGQAGFEFVRHPVSNSRIDHIDDRLPIEAEVSGGGGIAIDGRAATDEDLYDLVRRAVNYHREHHDAGYKDDMIVSALPDASWGSIIKVFDAARQTGDDDLHLVLLRPRWTNIIRMDPAPSSSR
jgi:biopolymer transport protein ExbD